MRHTRKAAVSPSPKTLINRRGSEGRGFESCRGDRARDSPDSSLLSPQVSRMGRLDHVTASFLNSPYRPSKPLVVARRVGRCLLNFKPIPSIVISVQGNEKVVVTLWHSRPLVHFAAHAQERAWNSIRTTLGLVINFWFLPPPSRRRSVFHPCLEPSTPVPYK